MDQNQKLPAGSSDQSYCAVPGFNMLQQPASESSTRAKSMLMPHQQKPSLVSSASMVLSRSRDQMTPHQRPLVPCFAEVPRCPKCRTAMAKKINQSGYNRGSPFWACPNYPDCRGTRRAQSGGASEFGIFVGKSFTSSEQGVTQPQEKRVTPIVLVTPQKH